MFTKNYRSEDNVDGGASSFNPDGRGVDTHSAISHFYPIIQH